jgi:DnaJ-class molecular chaperone
MKEKHWRCSNGATCDNCGRVLTAHINQRHCPCASCDGHGYELVRGLPGDAWPETCHDCHGTGRAA